MQNVELNAAPEVVPSRPALLTPVAVALAILTVAGVLTLSPGSEDFETDLAIEVIVTPAFLAVLWFLNKGRNWARLVMLWQCVLWLVLPFMWDELTAIERVLDIIWVFADVFLLIWLNLRPVKLFFKRHSKPIDTPPHSRPPIPEP